jgi:hypothetical protein
MIGCAEGSVETVEEPQPAPINTNTAPTQPSPSLCVELAPAVRKCGGKLSLADCEERMDKFKQSVQDEVRSCAKKSCSLMQKCLDDAIGESFGVTAAASPDGGTPSPRPDAGRETSTTTACQASLSSFTPGAYRPPRRQVGACTQQMATDFEDCMNGNGAKCQLFQTTPAYQACEACVFSEDTDPQWGPVVGSTITGFGGPNQGGCFAISLGEGTSATGCGGAMQAFDQCTQTACSRCPLSQPPTNQEINDLQSCLADAQSLPACAGYAQSAATQCRFDGGSPAACSGASPSALIQVFCGP